MSAIVDGFFYVIGGVAAGLAISVVGTALFVALILMLNWSGK